MRGIMSRLKAIAEQLLTLLELENGLLINCNFEDIGKLLTRKESLVIEFLNLGVDDLGVPDDERLIALKAALKDNYRLIGGRLEALGLIASAYRIRMREAIHSYDDACYGSTAHRK